MATFNWLKLTAEEEEKRKEKICGNQCKTGEWVTEKMFALLPSKQYIGCIQSGACMGDWKRKCGHSLSRWSTATATWMLIQCSFHAHWTTLVTRVLQGLHQRQTLHLPHSLHCQMTSDHLMLWSDRPHRTARQPRSEVSETSSRRHRQCSCHLHAHLPEYRPFSTALPSFHVFTLNTVAK